MNTRSNTRSPPRWRLAALALLLAAGHAELRAQAAPAPGWQACIASLRADLRSYPQISAAAFDKRTAAAQDLRATISVAAAAQPEFQLPIWDYVARLADAQRAADGRDLLQRQTGVLPGIERRYGVDRATLVAVLGVETDYGRVAGRYPVLDMTLSRACLAPASQERRRHFFAALSLLEDGSVAADEFRGSWAGAFGLTQFMPGTFTAYRAKGDERDASPVDIYHSVPDALATTASFLASLGWQAGLPWGVEVRVPAALAGRAAEASGHGCLLKAAPAAPCAGIARWQRDGVVRIDGRALDAPGGKRLDADTRAALLMPAGPAGPAWLVTRNYEAVWRYNRADAYALAIGLLADALRGEPPMRAPWPTDDPGLSRAEFREAQQLLVALGHDKVVPDGLDGPNTRDAVRAEERAAGWPESGRTGMKMLQRLRIAAAKAPPAPDGAASR
ncbi:MAG: lytic murein transglycosylase [Proteobacteria bacterium]|nr:lytic murein transglycosylase [Pseudomonadota bacterium]